MILICKADTNKWNDDNVQEHSQNEGGGNEWNIELDTIYYDNNENEEEDNSDIKDVHVSDVLPEQQISPQLQLIHKLINAAMIYKQSYILNAMEY